MTDDDHDALLNALDEEKRLGLGDELDNLLRKMKEVKSERDKIRDLEKELTKHYEALNTRAVALFESRDLKNIRSDVFGLAYRTTKVYPAVHDPQKLVEWLDEHGEGGIAKRTVHPQTLISWVNDRMTNGDEVPEEDIVSLHPVTKIAFRK